MHNRDILLSSHTLNMISDTLTEYRSLGLSIASLLIFDWPRSKPLIDPQNRGYTMVEFKKIFQDRPKNVLLSKYYDCVASQFSGVPSFFENSALACSVRFIAFYDKNRTALAQKRPTIDQLLESLSKRFETIKIWIDHDENASEVVKYDSTSLKLWLFDRGTRSWIWRRAGQTGIKRDGLPWYKEPLVEDGEPMTKVSPQIASLQISAKGIELRLKNAEAFAMKEFAKRIPFHSLAVPEPFYDE